MKSKKRSLLLSTKNGLFLISAQQSFLAKSTVKFVEGAREHGGDLEDYPIGFYFNAIEEEVIDLWMYLQALRKLINAKQNEDVQPKPDRKGSRAHNQGSRSRS